MNENLNFYLKNSFKIISPFWGLLVLVIMQIQLIDDFLIAKLGYDLFVYLYYFAPVLLLWLCIFLHMIRLTGLMPIIIMDLYLIYNGYAILSDTWLDLKNVVLSWDFKYIWDTISNKNNYYLGYVLSGITSCLVILGSITYLWSNKESFKFDFETRKSKKKPKHKNPYGSAKLATIKDIKKVSTPDGFVIGAMPKCSIDTYDIEKSKKKLLTRISNKLIRLPIVHAIIIAASRVGKGSGVLVPNILDHDGGVMVLDPKPELIHITKRHRETRGQKVFVFDPQNRSGLANCHINVLDFLDYDNEEHLHQQILNLADMLCPAPANATESNMHFIETGRNCLEFFLLFMVNADIPKEEMHLGTLHDMLTANDQDFVEMLESSSNSSASNGALASAANAILTTCGNEVSGVKNTARRAVNFTKSPYNRKAIAKSNIELKDICIDTNDFFICTKITVDNKPNKLTQFLTHYIFETIKSEKENSASNAHSIKDRLMVLDECPALGYLGFIDNALTYGAGFGIRVVGAFQSMEKVQNTFPNSWRTFLKSSLVIFINPDAEEATYVSDRIHKTTVNVESESSGTSQQSNQGQLSQNTSQQSGTTQSLGERHLLTPSEISSLGKKVIIAFTDEECPPIICRRINYYEDPNYKGKFDRNPLHNATPNIDKLSNIETAKNVVKDVSIKPPIEKKVLAINDDGDNLVVDEFYFNDRLLVVELNNKKTLMVTIDAIRGLILVEDENAKFVNNTYIYDNIKLSEDKKFFFWDNVNIKLNLREITNIFNNDRYSLIEKMNSAGVEV